MARPIAVLDILDAERAELERRVRATTTSQRDFRRARIVLLRCQGLSQREVAQQVGVSVACVSRWSRRFDVEGIAGLNERPGRGRRPSIPVATVKKVVTEAGQKPAGRGRWSTRTMANRAGISQSSVSRIWRRNDLKPHRTRTFKLSNDKHFESQFWDVIGLYLDPPEKAVVLCCDETTQCQALERTQPGLPLGMGHIRTRTHDYYRHGTICLFAAMNYLEGKLIYRTERRHTHVEWLRFLKQIDREVPKDLDAHLIADNYSTHKHAKVKAWLKRHKRFHMHYTPTSSSWMNLVERFFADLTQDCVRAGSFASVKELTDAITAYLAQRNEAPRPYCWKASGEKILEKIHSARKALEDCEINQC